MKLASKIICEHTRTIFVNLESGVHKFKLRIPKMRLELYVPHLSTSVNHTIIYYEPVCDKHSYYSPFSNTSSNGRVCLDCFGRDINEVENMIYNSLWTCSGDSMCTYFEHNSLFDYYKDWEKNGYPKLVPSGDLL